MKKKNIKSCFTWLKVNIKKKHGFKRQLKTEKIFHVLVFFSFMAKAEFTAGERAELYRSTDEEDGRRNINNKSVCKERGVSYNAFYVFRSRQHRKDNDGIAVKRIVPEPEATLEQDRIEISITTQCKKVAICFRGHCSVEKVLKALKDVQA